MELYVNVTGLIWENAQAFGALIIFVEVGTCGVWGLGVWQLGGLPWGEDGGLQVTQRCLDAGHGCGCCFARRKPCEFWELCHHPHARG